MTTSPTYETDMASNQDIYLFPTSLAQQRLWFLHQLEPQSPAYNLTANIRLNLALDVQALQASLNTLLGRHEVLRTSFVVVDGQPRQLITPSLTLPLPLVDLSALSERQQQAEILRLANQEAQQPFDLDQAPLVRARLLKLAEQDFLLLLTFHHIISDGWSNNVLFQELAALYDAFTHGQPSPLPPLPLQYVDFAIWQQEYIKRNGLSEQLAYWKQQLTGAPTTLDLPTDHPRPASSSSRGSLYVTTLPSELVDALKTLSRQQGTTLYITLVAAFQCLLSRYSSQEDLVLGTVASGRTQAELEPLIGFFVNTLVLRTDLSGNPTFSELLKRVREVALQAHAHQDVPFDYLVKELQPERILGQNPLFQVLLLLDQPTSPLAPGWIPSPIVGWTETSKFDLTLGLNEGPHGMTCHFEYSTDLFDAATIARMAGHWQTLLEGIVAHPERRLGELPLLTEAERHQLLVEWNETSSDFPKDQCIHQLFEAQVERTPDAVAVVFEDEHLTYRQLNRKANQLARYLQHLGVGPEVLVGLYMERSLEMVVGLLGILKAGGAYVPLDPTYPAERLAFMIQDAQVPVLLTQNPLVGKLPGHQARVVCLDTDWASIAHERGGTPINEVMADNLAYVIYTSGSTGKPKGVLVEHRNLLNYTLAIEQRLDLPAGASFAAVTTLATDLGNTAIFPTLCSGGCLHVISRERAIDAHALAKYFRRHPIDCLKITPSHLRALQAAAEGGPVMPRRRLVIGGEASAWEWLTSLQALAPECTIFNHYGPTETTVGVLTYRLQPEQSECGYTTTPLGRPLANTRIYLLDQYREPVPIGVPGEVYIGGASVARGYLNQPELTAERFIADSFSDEPGAHLYKTGDRARYLPDGNIEFLGRFDDQIKLRGFRIELGEIEAVLEQHPVVQSAVIMAREDVPGEKRLVAYVVLHAGQTATVGALQQHVMPHLPVYMVPSAFVLLEALPLTPNGKVDRRALPVPEASRTITEESYVAPMLLIHQQLVQIWEELLGVQPIGMRDNFFYLGGHSLLAARLVEQIEQVFGKRLALSTLFSGPTIAQLAEALQQQGKTDARTSVLPVQVGGSKRPFFFLHGDWTGGAFYCFALARALGPDQPFYVLEPYKFGGLQSLPSFETVAAAHIEALRAIQPEGPYVLGGFCNGGLLAYEMARQLEAAGERVDFLALIVPSAPVQYEPLRALSKRMSKLLRLGVNSQAHLFLRVRHALRHVYRTVRPSGERVQDFDKLLVIDPRLQRMFPPVEALYNDYVNVFNWVVSRYETGVYPGKITFFWASEEPLIEKTWLPVTEAKDRKEIESHIVPGTHMSCLTEHIQDLAECLSTCLSRLQEGALNQPVGAAIKNAMVKTYTNKENTHARTATISTN